MARSKKPTKHSTPSSLQTVRNMAMPRFEPVKYVSVEPNQCIKLGDPVIHLKLQNPKTAWKKFCRENSKTVQNKLRAKILRKIVENNCYEIRGRLFDPIDAK